MCDEIDWFVYVWLRNCVLEAFGGSGLNSSFACACRVERKLTEKFAPVDLEIIDESAGHAGHAGNPSGDPNAETHFRYVHVHEGPPVLCC